MTGKPKTTTPFVRVPHAVVLDTNLSVGARATYPVLVLLAYVAGRRKETDIVPMPTLQEIADRLYVSSGTAGGYVTELTAAGWLKTWRARKGVPRSFAVIEHDPQAVERVWTTPKSGAPSRARSSLVEVKNEVKSNNHSSLPAPVLLKVDGKNLALDALAEVCKVGQASPRLTRECVPAMNGSRRSRVEGIRDQYWAEVLAKLEERDGNTDAAVDIEPVAFEHALASAVRTRASVYRRVMGDAHLTPTALAKWWTDLPGMLTEARSTDLASRILNEADRLRQEGR